MSSSPTTNVSAIGAAEESADGALWRHEEEKRIAAWAAEHKAGYQKRQAFSEGICDQLMASGLQPSGAAVLRLGRWGNAGSIASDVADWYRSLASRLTAADALIPPPARRQATELVEQLWRLATVEVDQRKVEPLRQELGTHKVVEAQSELQITSLKNNVQETMLRIAELDRDLAEARSTIGGQERDATRQSTALMKIEAGKAAAEIALNEARLTRDRAIAEIAQTRSQAHRAMREAQLAAVAASEELRAKFQLREDALRRELLMLIDKERDRTKAAQSSAATAGEAVAKLEAQLDGANAALTNSAALLDAARQREDIATTAAAQRELRIETLERRVDEIRSKIALPQKIARPKNASGVESAPKKRSRSAGQGKRDNVVKAKV